MSPKQNVSMLQKEEFTHIIYPSSLSEQYSTFTIKKQYIQNRLLLETNNAY